VADPISMTPFPFLLNGTEDPRLGVEKRWLKKYGIEQGG
jgi:hypothetical protein